MDRVLRLKVIEILVKPADCMVDCEEFMILLHLTEMLFQYNSLLAVGPTVLATIWIPNRGLPKP